LPLDSRVKRFLDALAAGNPPSALNTSVAQRRTQLAELMKLSGPQAPVASAQDRTVPGPAGTLAVRIYTPLDAPGPLLPGLVYFHGGGLVAGSIDTHSPIARALAHAGACRVVAVEYRLAPEHPFPAALDDALAAIAHVAARAAQFGIDSARLKAEPGRLATIATHTDLGSGMAVAMKDRATGPPPTTRPMECPAFLASHTMSV
jgi:acetyl esterase